MNTTQTRPRFSSRFNANYNRRKRLKESIRNVFRNGYRFGWLSSAITKALNELKEQENWTRLPQSWQGELLGYIDGFRDNQQTTHLHLCNDGKYRARGEYTYDPALRKSPMSDNGKLNSVSTCVIVWSHKPDHVFYACDKHIELCKTCHVPFARDNWTHKIDYKSN